MPSASPQPTDQAERRETSDRKPRRWRRRVLWLLLAFAIVGAPLINGPVFRKVAHWQLGKVFHDLYLDGKFELSGTLLGGLSLRDVELEGSRNLQSLTIAQADVEYRLIPLIKQNWGEGVTRIHISGVDVKIDNTREYPSDAEIESRKARKREKRAAKDKPTNLWENLDALLQQDLRFDDLNLRLTSSGESAIALEGFTFHLNGGTGSIGTEKLELPNGQVSTGLSAQLTSTGPPIIQINSLDLAEQLRIERLSLSPPGSPGAAPGIGGELRLLDGRIVATQESPTRWRTKLASGSIDLLGLGDWLGEDFGVSGVVDHLDATIDASADYLVEAELGASQIAYQNHLTDTVEASIGYRKDQLRIDSLEVKSGTTTITASGEFAPASKSLRAEASVAAPDLAQLAENYDLPLAGSLFATTSVRLEDGKLVDSEAQIVATGLSYQGAEIARTTLRATDSTFDLVADIHGDESNTLRSNGTFNLDASRYDAQLELDLPKLAALHPLLESLEVKQRPAGNIKLSWKGSGSLNKQEHQGSAKIPAFDLTVDEGAPVSGQLDVAYAPDSYQLTQFAVSSQDLSISGTANLEDDRLSVTGLRLFNATQSIASAEVSVPLDTGSVTDLESFLDQPGDVSIQIDSDKLKLADLMAMLGKPAPVAATFDAEIDIGGTLDDPLGSGKLDILQLRSTKPSDIAPAEVNLKFQLGGGQLAVDGALRHPQLQPITIKGNTPLRVKEIGELGDQQIDLAFHLPDTDLKVAMNYLPDLTSADGSASADLKITGKLEEPTLSGELRIVSPLLKFKEQKLPTISDLKVAIRFEERQLQVQSFRGYFAGGEISVGGMVDLATLSDPQLDLSFTAQQALLFRNDNLSLRANADLKFTGPYKTASVAGKIGITQSRFFREIEILPIGLPKSSPTPAAPKAPSFASKRRIGVTAAPFKDWTADVHIVTDDPFLIRSNLAQGDVISDVRVSGTLGTPVPTGSISLEKGRATLPFSQLETKQATLTFSERTSFDPEINVRAESKIQNYNINLGAYGRLSEPKTIITSDPPLPETEAVALLATGVKSSDLNNSEVIAGTAALLLIDKVRRKFAKGTPLERRPGGLEDQLSISAGDVDPRTGRRTGSASLKVADNVFVLGNVDVSGQYRGLVKYIIRFK